MFKVLTLVALILATAQALGETPNIRLNCSSGFLSKLTLKGSIPGRDMGNFGLILMADILGGYYVPDNSTIEKTGEGESDFNFVIRSLDGQELVRFTVLPNSIQSGKLRATLETLGRKETVRCHFK